MKPTDTLKHEHQIVEHVLDAAKKEVLSIENTGRVNIEKVKKIVDFTKNFTDGCHHKKEENLLFPRLGERGMSKEFGPVAVMLREHDMGRQFIKGIVDNLDGAARNEKEAIETVKNSLNGYLTLLTNHIDKENNILFEMADQALTAEDQTWLEEEFNKVEEETGEGEHEKYHQMAHELAGMK